MSIFRTISEKFQQQGVLAQLIIINVTVFLTINLVGNLSHLNLLPLFALPIGGMDFLYKPWTLISYMFTHVGLGHIFWNMILLYFGSQIFFTIMGQKKLIYLYVMSGLSGGALVLIGGLVFPEMFGNAILLGASASVLGSMAVMAVYAPNYTVFLWGLFQMPYKYFYLLVFAVSTIIDLQVNTGGKISHIGGALFGVLYGYQLRKGVDLFNFDFLKRKNKHLKIIKNDTSKSRGYSPKDEEILMNKLLDKISKSGYDSLTKDEKDTLFKLSKKK